MPLELLNSFLGSKSTNKECVVSNIGWHGELLQRVPSRISVELRMKSMYWEAGVPAALDLNNVLVCHTGSAELVHLSSLYKSQETESVSQEL